MTNYAVIANLGTFYKVVVLVLRALSIPATVFPNMFSDWILAISLRGQKDRLEIKSLN